ncbi:MAG: trimeric intracellular cation channel family protein [Pseudomonadota bacterium]
MTLPSEALVLQSLDYLGVFVFALSGAVMAIRKEMDFFGALVLALMPAVGGGTLRDLVLDVPVFWLEDRTYLVLTLIASCVAWVALPWVERVRRLMLWSDALGLAVFCVLGASKTLDVVGLPSIAIMMGVVTAVAGGMARDVIANEIPLIMQREIYATAAFAGASVYVLLQPVDPSSAVAAGFLTALLLRAVGMLRGWSLPKRRGSRSL